MDGSHLIRRAEEYLIANVSATECKIAVLAAIAASVSKGLLGNDNRIIHIQGDIGISFLSPQEPLVE
jgi:hypothetical protein